MGVVSKLKELIWPSPGMGLPVYLDEGGEKFGYVTKVIKENGRVEGYEVTTEGGLTIHIPADSVAVSKKAIMYRPKWYVEGIEFIKRLEAQKMVTPELRKVLEGAARPRDSMTRRIVEEGKNIYKEISGKLIMFIEERNKLRQELDDLTHRRILGATKGSEYARALVTLRRKMEMLDANIKKAEEILRLLNYPVFRVEEEEEKPKVGPIGEKGMVPPPPKPATPEERANIKKLRVLKIERDLMLQEEKLKKAEEELKRNLAMGGGTAYELRWIEERLNEIDEELKGIENIFRTTKRLDDNARRYLLSRRDSLLKKKEELLRRKKELEEKAKAPVPAAKPEEEEEFEEEMEEEFEEGEMAEEEEEELSVEEIELPEEFEEEEAKEEKSAEEKEEVEEVDIDKMIEELEKK